MLKFGFGELTGIDLLYEKNANFIKPSSKSKMLNMVIGQEMLVTPVQVIQMINIIMGFTTSTDEEECRADMNQDGTINVFDVITIVNIILEN